MNTLASLEPFEIVVPVNLFNEKLVAEEEVCNEMGLPLHLLVKTGNPIIELAHLNTVGMSFLFPAAACFFLARAANAATLTFPSRSACPLPMVVARSRGADRSTDEGSYTSSKGI